MDAKVIFLFYITKQRFSCLLQSGIFSTIFIKKHPCLIFTKKIYIIFYVLLLGDVEYDIY